MLSFFSISTYNEILSQLYALLALSSSVCMTAMDICYLYCDSSDNLDKRVWLSHCTLNSWMHTIWADKWKLHTVLWTVSKSTHCPCTRATSPSEKVHQTVKDKSKHCWESSQDSAVNLSISELSLLAYHLSRIDFKTLFFLKALNGLLLKYISDLLLC